MIGIPVDRLCGVAKIQESGEGGNRVSLSNYEVFIIKRLIYFLPAVMLLTAVTSPAPAQKVPESESLIATGQKQLQAARTANTEEGYRLAEATFDRAMQLDAQSALARLYRGLTRLELSGWIAGQGRFGPSGVVLNEASADMDAAVAMAPDNLQVRMLRGLSYAAFPSFLNKGMLARDDLESVVHHPNFAAQSGEARAHAHFTLGSLYAGMGEVEKARAAWRAAVEAGPKSKDGQAAQGELEKLAAPVVAADAAGRRMPDRFPRIPMETAPIVVAATITFPDHHGAWERTSLPGSMQSFLIKLDKQPGLVGVHVLSSIDHPGMLVILTWWENKKALNDWFYSETHQGIITQYYGNGGRGPAATKPNGATGAMTQSSQVGIELFAPLPGGMAFGGGLTPTRRQKQ